MAKKAAPAGWYPYGTDGEERYWTGVAWGESRDEVSTERGLMLDFVDEGVGQPVLKMYENQIWKVLPPEQGQSTGGSIAGARAEVAVQNQLALRRGSSSTTVGAVIFKVSAPTYDFAFQLTQKRNQDQEHLDQLNRMAEFVNRRSRELAPLAAAAPAQAAESSSAVDEIRRFAGLRDEGLITEDEFVAKKAQLLGL